MEMYTPEYLHKLSREILELKEKAQTKKFANNDEFIARVNEKLEESEKRLNKAAKRYELYVKINFAFKKSFKQFTKEDKLSAKEQASKNQSKYTYTCEIYSLEDKPLEEKGIQIYPELSWEECPFFETVEEYEDYVKVLEYQFKKSLFRAHIVHMMWKESDFMDFEYDVKHNVDFRYKLDRFPNDKAFIKKMNEILAEQEDKFNEKYADKGIYCGLSFNFGNPIFIESDPEILREMTKEDIAEMKAPKYAFYCAIFEVAENPLDEDEELFDFEDNRGFDTQEAYEKYTDQFFKKVAYELARQQLLLTVFEEMPDLIMDFDLDE